MDDLVHFVKDLLVLEEEKKRAKDPNFKKKILYLYLYKSAKLTMVLQG
jgi:hypothetical protein